MPYQMTPDISSLLGYGAPQDPMGQPMDDLAAQQLAQQIQLQKQQEELFKALVAKQMTQGLGQGQRGDLAFSGPVAGYAGPLRESDVPSSRAVPIMPPQQASVIDQMQGLKLPGGANMEQLLPLLQSLKGVDDRVQSAILSKLGLGLGNIPSKLDEQKDLAQYTHGLGAGDRESNRAIAMARLAEAMNAAKSRQDQFNEKNRTPLKDATQAVRDAFEAGERDPARLAEIARGMGWNYQGGTSESKGLLQGRTLNPRLGVGGSRGEAPSQPAQSSQAPAKSAQGERVRVMAPNGQPGTVPASQLQEFTKRGFKPIQ